jgi:hypothetical protein
LKNVLGMLKGKDKYETAENYSVLFITIGALVLAAGIGLSAISARGIPAILAMMGSLITFLSTMILIFIWFVKGFIGKETGETSG